VPADRTVNGDVVAIGGNALVYGKVKGSVVAISGSIHLYAGASVAGDCIAIGGKTVSEPKAQVSGARLQVDAPWASELLAAAAKAEPEQPPAAGKAGSVVKMGQPIQVEAGEVVNGDVVAIGGPVTVLGTVKGDVVAVGGSVDVSGKVDGDAIAAGGSINLNPGASVRGDAVAVGGTVKKAVGSELKGERVGVGMGHGWGSGRRIDSFGGPVALLTHWLLQLILVLLALAIVPANVRAISDRIVREPGRAAAFGAVGLCLCLPILAILFVLVVTWVAIPLYVAAVAVLAILGEVAMCLVVGRLCLGWWKRASMSLWWAAFVGFLALRLVYAICDAAPAHTGLAAVGLVVLVLGFGGALMTWFGADSTGTWWARRMPPTRTTPATPATPPDVTG
jgi:cytoskeletal protein CcmA (bactofilin family)